MAVANPPVAIDISLVNNGWSLFKSARYQIANQTVEDISIHLPIASTILNIVSFSDNYSRSIATNMLWLKDTETVKAISNEFKTGTDADAAVQNGLILTPAGANAVAQHTVAALTSDSARGVIVSASIRSDVSNVKRPNNNKGYAKQKAFPELSKKFTMMLPLSTIFGFCRDYNKVFRGIKHTLILDRADQNDCLLRVGGNDCQFIISRLALWMPRVVISVSKLIELETMLSAYNRKIYFEQHKV